MERFRIVPREVARPMLLCRYMCWGNCPKVLTVNGSKILNWFRLQERFNKALTVVRSFLLRCRRGSQAIESI
jgi:hypothetical protein